MIGQLREPDTGLQLQLQHELQLLLDARPQTAAPYNKLPSRCEQFLIFIEQWMKSWYSYNNNNNSKK